MTTGYWGISGRYGGKVHVERDGTPLCGRKPHPKAEYQWCSNGINLAMLECPRCRDRAEALLRYVPKVRRRALSARKK